MRLDRIGLGVGDGATVHRVYLGKLETGALFIGKHGRARPILQLGALLGRYRHLLQREIRIAAVQLRKPQATQLQGFRCHLWQPVHTSVELTKRTADRRQAVQQLLPIEPLDNPVHMFLLSLTGADRITIRR